MLLLLAFALGVGLLLSTLAVYFPDVAEMYQIVLLAWMYLTPIIYPETIVPEAYRWWMFNLNPHVPPDQALPPAALRRDGAEPGARLASALGSPGGAG